MSIVEGFFILRLTPGQQQGKILLYKCSQMPLIFTDVLLKSVFICEICKAQVVTGETSVTYWEIMCWIQKGDLILQDMSGDFLHIHQKLSRLWA